MREENWWDQFMQQRETVRETHAREALQVGEVLLNRDLPDDAKPYFAIPIEQMPLSLRPYVGAANCFIDEPEKALEISSSDPAAR